MFQSAALRVGRRSCTAPGASGGFGSRLRNKSCAVRATSTFLTNSASSQNAIPSISTTNSSRSCCAFLASSAWKQSPPQTTATVRGFQSMYAPALAGNASSSSQQQQQWAVQALAAAAVAAGVLCNADNNDHLLSRAFCCGIVGVVGKKDHGDARYAFILRYEHTMKSLTIGL